MREIKFRGKRIDNGEWVFGDYSRYSKEHHGLIMVDLLEQEEYWVSSKTVAQYTGLHDKNGVEIYEGDIVLCDRNINDRFDKTTFLIGLDEYFRYQGVSKLGNEISVEEFEWAEVIGNIHDSQELDGLAEDKK